MHVRIEYTLTQAGQKADILAGGTGAEHQHVDVPDDAPEYRRAVEEAVVATESGRTKMTVNLKMDWSNTRNDCTPERGRWDHIPTAVELLDDLDARRAAKAREIAERRQATRQATIDALASRKTCVRREDVDGPPSTTCSIMVPDWPYQADPEIVEGAEAKAWVDELERANDAARAEAVRIRAAILESEAKAEAEREAKEKARRAALGLKDGEIDICVESRALIEAPVWESHRRGKNWMAVIEHDPKSPGGLRREFADKAKGEAYYLMPDLSPGDAIEFGADYYTGSGRKSADRWYGYVVRTIEETEADYGSLILRPCATGKEACTEGKKHAEAIAKAEAAE